MSFEFLITLHIKVVICWESSGPDRPSMRCGELQEWGVSWNDKMHYCKVPTAYNSSYSEIKQDFFLDKVDEFLLIILVHLKGMLNFNWLQKYNNESLWK